MFFFYIFLLIIKLIISELNSKKDYDFPPNNLFNVLGKDNKTIYFGSNIIFVNLNDSLSSIKNQVFLNYNYNAKYFSFKKENNENEKYYIGYCPYLDIHSDFSGIDGNKKDKIEHNICIEKNTSLYGEIILMQYEILSYSFLFFGFFIILYGATFLLFGILVNSTFFLYFFIKDLFEIYGEFSNSNNPLFLFTGMFITGVIICIILRNYKKDETQEKILRIFSGCVLGYFFYKTLSYFIVFFLSSANKTAYFIFIFFFILIGTSIGISVQFFNSLEKYFFILCTSIPGSFYIIKGIAYIVGGYYSEAMKMKKKLKFTNCNSKIVLYMLFQIFLIALSVVFQLFYSKFQKRFILIPSRESSKNLLISENLLDKDMSKLPTSQTTNDVSRDSINKTNDNNITSINNVTNSDGDNSNNIYDQED